MSEVSHANNGNTTEDELNILREALSAEKDAHNRTFIKLRNKLLDQLKQTFIAENERDQCAILIGKMAIELGWGPTGVTNYINRGTGKQWQNAEPYLEFRTLLLVQLPTGQVMWPFCKTSRINPDGFPSVDVEWDGHSIEEKYERIKSVMLDEFQPEPMNERID